MARIRCIKPEFPQSESIGRLSRDGRLLFIQLWTVVDDAGKARAASRLLASLLYPYDDDAPSMIDGWLKELERERILVVYEVDGTRYLQISNWLKHQKIDRPSPSKIPSFSEPSRALATNREPTMLDKEEDRERKKDPVLRTDAEASRKPKSKDGPNDPKTILWRDGREIVGRLAGKDIDGAGKLVGSFVDDAKSADGVVDHGLVLEVIRDAEKQHPDKPIPWIRAAIKARVSGGGLFGSSLVIDGDDPGGVNAWCAANGVAPTTSPGDTKIAKWIAGGVLFDVMARDILLAAGMAFDRPYDWSLLRQWAEAGIDSETIYQTIKRMVGGMKAKGDYTPPSSLKFFDNVVRSSAGRAAA